MGILLLSGRAILPQTLEGPPDFQKADNQIIRLPSSSFLALPSRIRRELDRRGCSIPQVSGASKPGNTIKGSFVQSGEIDSAVLCSVNRTASILIFRYSSADGVVELAREADINKLQGEGSGQIGYSRAISPVGREFIMRHYQA